MGFKLTSQLKSGQKTETPASTTANNKTRFKLTSQLRQAPVKPQLQEQPKKTGFASKVNSGLQHFNAYSRSLIDPFKKRFTLSGTDAMDRVANKIVDKGKALFGETPQQQQARHQRIAQGRLTERNLVNPTAGRILNAAGDVAGTIGGLGKASEVANLTVGKGLTRLGTTGLAKRALTEAGTGAIYEGTSAFNEREPLKNVANRASKGALLFGVAGPAGGLSGAGVKKLLPGAAGHYVGNAIGGGVMGAGFSYGGNLLEGQPLDHAQAGKNALAFGGLGLVTGGRAAIPEPSPLDTKTKIVSGNKKETSGGLWERLNHLYTRTVDTQRPISRFTKDAKLDSPLNPKVLASNSRNSQGITSHIFETGLVDSHGNQIGAGYRDLLKSVPKNLETDFSYYLLHKHNIARMAQNKPVFGDVPAEASAAKVAEYEALHPEFKELGGKVNSFIDTFMKKWTVETGLLTPEQYQAMKDMYPDYVPTYRDFSELEKGFASTGTGKAKSFVGRSAGIKKATGSERPIIDPLESVMGLVDKTVKAAKHNEVGQSIVRAIQENPEGLKRWAEIVPTKQGLVDDINKTLKEDGLDGVVEKFSQEFDQAFNKPTLNKDNMVRVMMNGQPVYLKINDKSFLDAVKGLMNSDQGAIEKAFRKGAGIYKALITGKNPIFAIRNIARDIPTAYINGTEKNPVKFLLDLVSSGKDILTKGQQFKEYKALGGGSANFFSQDTNLLKTGGSLPRRAVNVIERFNNFTETVPRYAEYKRTANRAGNDYAAKQQGLYAANEVTTNFSRSGDVTKTADAFVPYLNPAVQGLDKVIRQFVKHPIATVLKGATAITAPTLLLNHVNDNDPNYKKLDNRTKDNYYLIPKGDGTFFKLPKSRELGVLFGSLTERILRAAAEEQNSFKGWGNTVLTNFSPSNPIENNILSAFAYNIPKNKDFANRTIVPQSMQDRSPRYQYDDQTTEIAKAIGDIMNWSPKQIDYLIKSYTGIIGQLLMPATTKANYLGGSPLEKTVKPISLQFTADPLYSNQTITDFYDNYDKLQRIAADRNFTEDIPSKAVTPEEKARNAFMKAAEDMSSITKEIKYQEKVGNPQEIKRLRQVMIDIATKYNEKLAQSQIKP